jgi:hypothetical protein
VQIVGSIWEAAGKQQLHPATTRALLYAMPRRMLGTGITARASGSPGRTGLRNATIWMGCLAESWEIFELPPTHLITLGRPVEIWVGGPVLRATDSAILNVILSPEEGV